ncbi:hypothetical protein MKX70_11820 [Paenibacillus sp. FSL R7-0312]|uniref:hypothetical protein n=1 Tax=unclassified Paenibacillus TaxID=185978 RepID=UPI0004F856C9|nr:hypothetical protein [Paenibacillus sp. FSL R5-0912]AIQ43420.1 hypothetical protein R50912_27920 [Paenibacillus sp. FSL R5-0912]
MSWEYHCEVLATHENNQVPDLQLSYYENSDRIVRFTEEDFSRLRGNFRFNGEPTILKYVLKIKEIHRIHDAGNITSQKLSKVPSEDKFFNPIYFMTAIKLGLSQVSSLRLLTEEIAYIGKTNSTKARFKNGHNATTKLHNPIWEGDKKIYMAQVNLVIKIHEFINQTEREIEFEMPLEWFHSSYRDKILNLIEPLLIYRLNPVINIQLKKTVVNQEEINIPIVVINDIKSSDRLRVSTPVLAILAESPLYIDCMDYEKKKFSTGVDWEIHTNINC